MIEKCDDIIEEVMGEKTGETGEKLRKLWYWEMAMKGVANNKKH